MHHRIAILLSLLPMLSWGQRQTCYQYSTDDARLVFFDKNLSRYIPHIVRMYDNGKALHQQVWTTNSLYAPEAPLLWCPVARRAQQLFLAAHSGRP